MTLTEYAHLKQQIILTVGSSERHDQLLSTLKDLYKTEINSPRRYEQINSVGQLLNILELRDIVSEDNVRPLKLIAQKVPNGQDLLRNIGKYEVSHVCREPSNQYVSENTSSVNREPINNFSGDPFHGTISKSKRDRILKTVIEETGIFWKDLARNLHIRECVIDDINTRYKTLSSKTSKFLEEYEQRCDPQRWFDDLCYALEKSRRRDLSKSLRKIMAMNI